MPIAVDGSVTGALTGLPTLNGNIASVQSISGEFTVPEGGATEIFWATFNNTFEELEDAYQAGKEILLRFGQLPYIHYLTLHNDNKFVFSAVFQGPSGTGAIAVSYAVCNSTDGWLSTEVRMASDDGLLPSGGNIGDIVMKRSGEDYDAEWVAPATSAEQDNTRPITAAAVYTEIGNINSLLATI